MQGAQQVQVLGRVWVQGVKDVVRGSILKLSDISMVEMIEWM